MNGLLAKKIMMHQMFTADGKVMPVTFLEVLPNVVTQVKTVEQDQYQSLQLGTGFRREKLISKPIQGHLAKSKSKTLSLLKEFRAMKGFKLGEKVSLAIFEESQYVDVQALSKGKGTAGVIKRHNFSRGPMSHGSKHHRAPGSVGISRPDKVWKGQPLPGRKGNVKATVQNLKIVKIDLAKNLLVLKGSIPGNNNSYCKVQSALKKTQPGKPLALINWSTKDSQVSAESTSLKTKPKNQPQEVSPSPKSSPKKQVNQK